MSKTPTHTIEIEVEPGWGLNLKTTCPWEPSNKSRPCWPQYEDGVPYEDHGGTMIGCVYTDWVDEVGIEAFKGPSVKLTLPMFAKWINDRFEFFIGEEQEG